MLSILCKWAGLLTVMGCCTAAGFLYSASLSRKARLTEQLIRYWQVFLLMLRHGRGEPGDILRLLAGGAEFRKFSFAQDMGRLAARERDFGQILRKTLECSEELTAGVSEAMRPLVDTIGRCELENQLRLLENTLLMLEAEKRYWTECTQKRGGLSRRLGVMSGLLAVVILL